MQHMEREAELNNVDLKLNNSSQDLDEKLLSLGDRSFILNENSSCLGRTEAEKIHSENMSRLSQLTHDERLKEKNELMSHLAPELIEFLRSLRQKKLKESGTVAKEHMEVVEELCENQSPDQGRDENSKMVFQEEEQYGVNYLKSNEHEVLSQLPISVEEAKKWTHMDKVEIEKLKWMTEIPKAKPLKGKEGYVARFNFQGDLLPYESEDVSLKEGLHHHGEEPGRPGYSIDELFLFVRSRVIQQRHLGLKTIANILRNAKEGLYDTCFDSSIIQLMVDAGLVLLLRFAIDETSPLVYQEALRALYFLVVSEPDEKCLSVAEPWMPFSLQPGVSSLTHSKEKDREELDAEEEELKDVEVINLDMVRALVRMDVHIRLRYLLESVTLCPGDVMHILGILQRMARHSLESAAALVKTPRLIGVVVRRFLPHDASVLLAGANVDALSSVDGVPLCEALTFIKVLVCRGRYIAAALTEQHDLVSRILAYVSLEPTEAAMPLSEALRLAQEAYALWAALLAYGLTAAQRGVASFFPLFVKQLLVYRDKVDVADASADYANRFNYEVGARLADVLTKALNVAATHSLLEARMRRSEASVSCGGGGESVLQPPLLCWSDFAELFALSRVCLTKWTMQLSRAFDDASLSALKLVGAFCAFVGAYLTKWRDQDSFEATACIAEVEDVGRALAVLLSDVACDSLARRARTHSALCSELRPGKGRDPANLGSLGAVCEGGMLIPVLQKGTPFPLLLPLSALLLTLHALHPGLSPRPARALLDAHATHDYLRAVVRSSRSLGGHWLARPELHAVANVVRLGAAVRGCDDPVLVHCAAVAVVALLPRGDEAVVARLIEDVVANSDFIGDQTRLEADVDALTVHEHRPLSSPSLAQPALSSADLSARALRVLPAIGHTIVRSLLPAARREESAVRARGVWFLTNSLCEDDDGEEPMGAYWPLRPLALLLALNDATTEARDRSDAVTISDTSHWLQMAFLLLRYRRGAVEARTSTMGWVRHLSNVFLASNDLFLDGQVSSYTQACLATLLGRASAADLDPSAPVAGLRPGADWYKRLVSQFSGVSYGDSTFALFVLLGLLRHWPSSFKVLLFGEFTEALAFVRLSTDDVTQFMPLEWFLCPPEDDETVLGKYVLALRSGLVQQKRTPFLHQFLLHHVTKFNDKVNKT